MLADSKAVIAAVKKAGRTGKARSRHLQKIVNEIAERGEVRVPYFWTIANASTSAEYHHELQQLRDFHPQAADYLQSIEPKLWVTAFYISQYYGHKTSNVVESTNRIFKEKRELPILELLDTIWHYVMSQRFKRYTKATSPSIYLHTPYCYQQLLNNHRWATSNTVQISNNMSGIITQRNHKTYVVDMVYRTCSCGHFQPNGIPCGHVFSFIYTLQTLIPTTPSPRDYIPYFFTLLAWKNTYAQNISPVSLLNLPHQADISLAPPTTEKRYKGRPKIKRGTIGEQRKIAQGQARLHGTQLPPNNGPQSQACGHCGEYGHNRVSCL